MNEVTRYRHRWKMPNGEFEYEFGGFAWHPTREAAIEGRTQLIKRAQCAGNGDYTDYFHSSWEWDIEEKQFPVFQKEGNHTLIFLEEEYGYRHWIWHTQMSEEELCSFWTNLESVDAYFFDHRKLPVLVIPAGYDTYGRTGGYWSWDPHTHQPESDEGCDIHRPQETPVFFPEEIMDGDAHIHMDNDSGIRIGDKGLRHKGFNKCPN